MTLAQYMYAAIAIAILGVLFFSLPGMLGADDLIEKNINNTTMATQTATDLSNAYGGIGEIWGLLFLIVIVAGVIAAMWYFFAKGS